MASHPVEGDTDSTSDLPAIGLSPESPPLPVAPAAPVELHSSVQCTAQTTVAPDPVVFDACPDSIWLWVPPGLIAHDMIGHDGYTGPGHSLTGQM